MLASCWCQAAKCETKMWLKTKRKSTKLANETKSVLPCLWNLWLATKLLPSNKDYPSIHLSSSIWISTASFFCSQRVRSPMKRGQLVQMCTTPSAFDKWKYKGSHSSVCAQTVFRMYLTSSGQTKLLLYKINKLIIVFRLVCLHCLKAVIAANSWFTVRLYLLVVTGNRGFFKFLKGVHHQFSIAAKVEIPVDSLSLSNLLQQNKRCCFIHSVHFPDLLSSLQPQPMLTQEIT